MPRLTVASLVVGVIVAGCAATPRVPLTAEQQKFRDQEVRLLFARLIAGHGGFGTDNLIMGKREYSNVLVSGPERIDENVPGFRRICARLHIKNYSLMGDKTVELSGESNEGPRGVRVTMGRYEDFFGPKCKGPYTPFPELAALGPKAS